MEAANPKSLDYLYGFAVHFYADNSNSATLYDDTKREFPNKVIINTEACEGSDKGHSPELGSWDRAENYILKYIDVSNTLMGCKFSIIMNLFI